MRRPDGGIETGGGLVWIYPNADRPYVAWACPTCGRGLYGRLGDRPVSGWDEPRWVLSGTDEEPTLEPSLGCPSMTREPGHHFWLRAGRLVPA